MMAALVAKERLGGAAEVVLLERNAKLGVKVAISGGGRCNVTTGKTKLKEILENYPRGAEFLRYAMKQFDSVMMREFLHSRGLKTKVEEDGRVFPISDVGQDVVDLLAAEMRRAGVEIRLNTAVKSLELGKGLAKKMVVFYADEKKELFDQVVLACGGNAFAQTGSTGDGYAWAKAMGHHITQLGPSLMAFVLAGGSTNLAGLSLAKVGLKMGDACKVGPVVFTHQGISGPALFVISAHTAWQKFDSTSQNILYLDLFPELNLEQLDAQLRQAMEQDGAKKLINILDYFLAKSLAGAILRSAAVDGEKKAAEIGKKERLAVVKMLKAWPRQVVGRAQGEEFVTAGGVDTTEVNEQTMESKICPGLFLAGEILNVDGFTGGFNLQASWATGHLAGLNVGN